MRLPHLFLAAICTATIGLAFAQTPAPSAAPGPTAASPTVPAGPMPPAPAPQGAKAWLLMDAATGQILAGENIDAPVEPASITKVMTSYVVASELKNGKIKSTDMVTISENAWRGGGGGTDGSTSFLPLNGQINLAELEKGMVIQSGNDAAIALAEHVAGSEQAFVSLMNSYAQRIGMKHTRFMNPHGLSAEGHVSTAHDLALMGRAMIRDFPDAYAYNKMKELTVNGITQHNRNGLLWKDPSVDGIKTGHTSSAGFCLLASAMRDKQRLISVVMGIESKSQADGFRLREMGNLNLLNWGFRFFESHTLYVAGAKIAEPKVWKGKANLVSLGVAEDMLINVPRGRYQELKPSMDIPKFVTAPLKKGQPVGTVRVSLDGKVVAERPLVAMSDVEEAGFFGRLWDEFWMWWES
jgi:serine-type D-Ala-D-Ala carboxypeptidase (penicillin-binding protein 5/6)